MSYSYFKKKLSSGDPAIQIGVNNKADINSVHNTTQRFKVQSEKINTSTWVLFVVGILIIVATYIIIRRKWKVSGKQ